MSKRIIKEEWIEVQEAAAIVSQNSGRQISPDYVRLAAHKGRIQMKPKDARQNYYLKSDVEKITVRQNRRSSTPGQRPTLEMSVPA